MQQHGTRLQPVCNAFRAVSLSPHTGVEQPASSRCSFEGHARRPDEG
jgi:hypothetical protein